MNASEYAKEALRTVNHKLNFNDKLSNFALGLGEAGEVQNIVKKIIFHGHSFLPLREKILDECGDILWYVVNMLTLLGFTVEEAFEYNINKLKKRYPEGFSEQASINRKE